MKIKRIITVLLAALMIISIGALLSGCGDEETKKASDTKETAKVTETTAETTSAVTETEADTGSDDSDTDSSSDSYIDRQTAVANVKQQAGSGAKILSVKKGTGPDGLSAWVVVVEPITNGEGPDTVTYYVNDGFCYTE